MGNKRDISKVKKALLELKYASMLLGDIRPSAELKGDDFFELVDIKKEIDNLGERLKTVLEK